MLVSDPSPTSRRPVIVAASAAMQRILDIARRAAASDATVLIQGETGTGKELVARTIHDQSERSGGPFVAVNCGAYTDSLLASELFGHVRGAFTGAVTDRAGVFETASRGTVFLDEIGEMSPTMQVKMLRVMQERLVIRVGSSKETHIDVRVIAATNTDLVEKIRRQEFREDLYYRVKVVSCVIPPLRDRPDDIDPLIDHFLAHFCALIGHRDVTLAPAARKILQRHAWPGNVRQIRGEIEQLVSMAADGTVLAPNDLSLELRGETAMSPMPAAPQGSAPPAAASIGTDRSDATYQALLDEWTRAVIEERLTRFAGNITRTAQSLAISRSTLYALLKKYGMHGLDE
ncbi:MAG: sigma-54-dependent Fis family transcriptional regulator [Phycisphaerales bacterium]|nr:sigma-54-dependent Fis family transcriptional regulator [Phycisphaerales bacterium]